MPKKSAQWEFEQSKNHFLCIGEWTVVGLDGLLKNIRQLEIPNNKKITLSGKSLIEFDSAGALALIDVMDIFKSKDNEVQLSDFSKNQKDLVDLVKGKEDFISYKSPVPEPEGIVHFIGREAVHKLEQVDGLIILIGDLSTKIVESFGHWRKFQIPSIISNINSTGVQALPILGLLSFLIGIVLAYQMGLQLETYGANIFIAYLTGMANLREFAPLITAVIVAGRTSSAFTAQLGSMKINEEVDAIETMGLSSTQLLIMPKVIGLLLVFPLLIFWADICSMLGSMIMSKHMLGIGYVDFINRLKDSVGLKQMLLGLYKAPTYALLISLVGCLQGFRVESNADSIGSQTTKAVVQALFLIIIADAVYSVIYSWIGV